MLKVRIIPILTFNGLALVKTKQFASPRMVGNPIQAARVYNSRGVDELIFVDITATQQKRKINLKVVEQIIAECFMPVGLGGGITTLDEINALLRIGADKVVIKTEAIRNPAFIQEAVRFFGSQCISIAVDARRGEDGYRIHHLDGSPLALHDFVRQMEDLGAGELIVNSVDNDGLMQGFDTALVREVCGATTLPVVAVGGAGNPGHFVDLFASTPVEAAGAASIYHFTQHTPTDIKKALAPHGVPVRMTDNVMTL
jgi:cyclase